MVYPMVLDAIWVQIELDTTHLLMKILTEMSEDLEDSKDILSGFHS